MTPEEQSLKLWEHYEERADSIKKSMVANTTWLLGFASAILAFTFEKFFVFSAQSVEVKAAGFAALFCGAGVVICIYALFTLEEFGNHIKRNWDDADYFRVKAGDMPPLTAPPRRKKSVLPAKIWHRLEVVVVMFLVSFVLLGIYFLTR